MNLITGTSGLVGSHLIVKLLRAGEKIKAMVRSEESKDKILKLLNYHHLNEKDIGNKLEWLIGDILFYDEYEYYFKDVTKVYHCAAMVSFNDKDKTKLVETNFKGTRYIVNMCLKNNIKKLLHFSSVAAIDSTEGGIIKEQSGWPINPKSEYSYSKTQAELEVWRGIAEGLTAVILNPTVIIGPSDWNSGSMQLFQRIYKGMKYYTKGSTGFVDVYDVVSAAHKLMNSEICSERYILNGENLSYKEFFGMVADGLNVAKPTKPASYFLTELAWRLDKIRSKICFNAPKITKVASRIAHNIQTYSSQKFIQETNFSFTPIQESVIASCNYYLSEHPK